MIYRYSTCNCFKKKLTPDRLLKIENRDTCKPSNSYVSFNFHLCLPPTPQAPYSLILEVRLLLKVHDPGMGTQDICTYYASGKIDLISHTLYLISKTWQTQLNAHVYNKLLYDPGVGINRPKFFPLHTTSFPMVGTWPFPPNMSNARWWLNRVGVGVHSWN